MANHWFDMVKHLYKNKKIDDIGLLYSNLMFPNMNPQNNELYSNEFIDNLKPIQDQYSHRIDLGDGYSVSIHVNESSNFELRNVANRIYHIESQRKTKLGAINERVIKLAQMKFV